MSLKSTYLVSAASWASDILWVSRTVDQVGEKVGTRDPLPQDSSFSQQWSVSTAVPFCSGVTCSPRLGFFGPHSGQACRLAGHGTHSPSLASSLSQFLFLFGGPIFFR